MEASEHFGRHLESLRDLRCAGAIHPRRSQGRVRLAAGVERAAGARHPRWQGARAIAHGRARHPGQNQAQIQGDNGLAAQLASDRQLDGTAD